MNDIELIQMLRNNVGVSKAACDAAYEAADRIEELSATQTAPRPLSEAEAFALSAPTNASHASMADMQEWMESIQQPDPRDEVINRLVESLSDLAIVADRAVELSLRYDDFKVHAMEPLCQATVSARAALAAAKTLTKETKE